MSCSLRASHPIIIDITTRPEGTRYILNNMTKTPGEIQTFLRAVIEQFGQPEGVNGVFVCPDARTPLLAVFELMRHIRDSGVTRWHLVGAPVAGSPDSLSEALVVTSESFQPARVPFVRSPSTSK